jgi:hypothetical protein
MRFLLVSVLHFVWIVFTSLFMCFNAFQFFIYPVIVLVASVSSACGLFDRAQSFSPGITFSSGAAQLIN